MNINKFTKIANFEGNNKFDLSCSPSLLGQGQTIGGIICSLDLTTAQFHGLWILNKILKIILFLGYTVQCGVIYITVWVSRSDISLMIVMKQLCTTDNCYVVMTAIVYKRLWNWTTGFATRSNYFLSNILYKV